MTDTKTQEAASMEIKHGSVTDMNDAVKIAIPDEVLEWYNPEAGDELKITVLNGYIYVMPVAVYPQEKIDMWQKDIDAMDALDAEGNPKHYTNVDDLFNDMEDIEAGVTNAV